MATVCWRADRNDWFVFADEISITKWFYQRDEFQTELFQNFGSKQAVYGVFLVSANPHQHTILRGGISFLLSYTVRSSTCKLRNWPSTSRLLHGVLPLSSLFRIGEEYHNGTPDRDDYNAPAHLSRRGMPLAEITER
jgi:hypothetical protein